jgi:hypothetical protein
MPILGPRVWLNQFKATAGHAATLNAAIQG